MKIIISGGTGFIGKALVQHFLDRGAACVVIGRSADKIEKIFGNHVKPLVWQQIPKEGLNEIKTADLVINLAGASIGDKRWTKKRKQEILDSRIIPTRTLAQLCAQLGRHSPPLFSADGVGIYGLQSSLANGLPPPLDETIFINFEQHIDFLSKVGHEWELATEPAKKAGVRVVNMRFGVVLGKNGGMLAKMKWPFLFFIGGPIGSGQQPFSWIALTDLTRAIDFLFEHSEISGPVNLVAPQCITQKEFAKALGKALHRPSFFTTPGCVLKIVFSKEMAEELLLNGQNVQPKILVENGFQFQLPTIDSALKVSY